MNKYNKIFFPFIIIGLLLGMELRAQNAGQVQHIRFDDRGWEKMADKLERKYVYGEQGMLALFRMDKGARVPLHSHPNEQTTYITKGSVRVTMQGKDYVVKAGEVLIIPGGVPHEFECLEDGTLDIDFFAPPRMDWINGTAGYFTAQQDKLETVAALDIRPGNVAVAPDGRVFATIHPLGNAKIQLVEIRNGVAHPYPDASFQKNGAAPSDKALDTPLGITVDKKGRLWVLDMGQELGRTRLWCFDPAQNRLLEKIELTADIAPKGSFIQDLAVDEPNGWAYLADIADPGIIAVNLKTKKARRFGKHASLQSEDIDMVIDGKVTHFGGSPARVAVNPITLSRDGETLYFGAMSGTAWYKVPARLFREGKDDAAIGTAIQKVGPKPISDGAVTDARGNHYFTDVQEHAIGKLSADGKLTNILQDARLIWPDNLSLGADGYLYISVNQLNLTPSFTGKNDEGKPPYFIYRFKL